jgi:16S rRNA (uracil1498-N3)-methyltransferase
MSGRCFFIGRVEPGQDCVLLDERASHHTETVLRLKTGDCVELRDGCGNAWQGEIAQTGGGAVRVRLGTQCALEVESRLELTLAIALGKQDRMDVVVRQATELGVTRLVAFRAERSQYGLSGEQTERRLFRWIKIAQGALCQCGRTRLPELIYLPGVQELVARSELWQEGPGGLLKVVAREEERRQSLMELLGRLPHCRQILAVVGPEGGWTREEEARFFSAGFHPVHLGPRILRLETAAVALLSLAQLLWGDFS